ncbi:MAG: hypothetical protein R3B06_30415 [Kofleriaceae bacterium]
MTDQPLRAALTAAVEHLRAATDLTTDEVLGIRALPESLRTPDVCHALGVIEGAALARHATRRELLDDFGLLAPPPRSA